LAATLQAIGSVPVAGLTLLLGVDRFMSEMRALTNLVGNGIATIVVSKWEGEIDTGQMMRVLDGDLRGPGAAAIAEAAAIEPVPFLN
jgi:aerobic C4-dicarboxylate transport protein